MPGRLKGRNTDEDRGKSFDDDVEEPFAPPERLTLPRAEHGRGEFMVADDERPQVSPGQRTLQRAGEGRENTGGRPSSRRRRPEVGQV